MRCFGHNREGHQGGELFVHHLYSTGLIFTSKLDDLHVHTGTYATVYVVQGHINDTIQSTMHGTDNSKDFWEDVYDSPMADVLCQYEQWACTQNQSQSSGSSLLFYFVLIKYLRDLNEHDSLETVRKQARKLIVRGLGM
jgi:hypothetical protein